MAEEHVWDPLRRKEVALTPEERVRQWFITVLRDELGVPPYEMMSEATLSYGGKAWRADIVVYRRNYIKKRSQAKHCHYTICPHPHLRFLLYYAFYILHSLPEQ